MNPPPHTGPLVIAASGNDEDPQPIRLAEPPIIAASFFHSVGTVYAVIGDERFPCEVIEIGGPEGIQ